MLLAALMLTVGNPAYGPLTDRYTGKKCPQPIEGADLYDQSLYPAEVMLTTAPAVFSRCTKARQALLDKATRKPKRRL
jgi:hypothetical protein